MKLEKLKKLKDNRYEVVFDNDIKMHLYDDIIIKYELLLKRELKDAEFSKLEQENELLKSYYQAIKYINVKLRSEKEIRVYLEKKEFGEEEIEETIKRLENDGLINSKLYLDSYINDQVNLTTSGYFKIFNNLVKLGFCEDEIKEHLNQIEDDEWKSKCSKLIDKKLSSNSKYSGNKLKEKIIYDLMNLGYSKDMIIAILDNYDLNDSDLLEKEYYKLYKKLDKKYSGNELKYQIRNKLYQKGFNLEDINNIME